MSDKTDTGSSDVTTSSKADNSQTQAEEAKPGNSSRDNGSDNQRSSLTQDEKVTEQVDTSKQAPNSSAENPEEMDSDTSFVVLEKSASTDAATLSNRQSDDVNKETATTSDQAASTEVIIKGDPIDTSEQMKIGEITTAASASLAEPESSSLTRETGEGRPDTLPVTPTTAAESGSVEEGGAVGGGSKTGGAATAAASTSAASQGESVYYVKWIVFNGNKVPVITQNENGPCPLLAIMNVLLLKGKVRLAPLVEMITSEQLMAHLGDCVVESRPKNLDEAHRVNYEQNMQDAMNLMYKLQTGLDVNVKFTGVSDFEYTSECIIFDLLEIGLYHGWLVDPQDSQNVGAVGKCSYNQLVERVIHNKQSPDDHMVQEALIAEQFLDSTASQLTYHGLCELSSTIKDQELCVFFRNNHFSTLHRHDNELFLLVTDQGFLTESNVVWETLSTVDGDCHFVDANFLTYTKPPPSTDPIPTSPYLSGDEQINSDYQVALSLQHHDDQIIAEQAAAWGQFQTDFSTAQSSDHELALRLQEEEDRRAAAALQEQRSQNPTGQGQGQAGGQAQGQAGAQGQGQGQAAGGGDPRRGQREQREDRRDKKEGKDCCIL